MLTSAVALFSRILLSVLLTEAQAEPAPPAGTPETPLPALPELLPEPDAPEPQGQAEALPDSADQPAPEPDAPPALAPPADEQHAPLLPTDISFIVRGSYRLPPASDDLPPAFGYGFALALAHRYAHLGEAVDLGLELDLGYQRHERAVDGTRTEPDGTEATFAGHRIIAQHAFALSQTISTTFFPGAPPADSESSPGEPPEERPVRVWAGAGGGLAVLDFQTDEKTLRPGISHPARALVRFAAGIEFTLTGTTFLGIRADHTWVLDPPVFTAQNGSRTRIMSSLFAFGLQIGSRF